MCCIRLPLTLNISGKQFTGLLDTGADTTCFSPQDWPPDWPTASTFDNVSGIAGSVKRVLVSANKLVWQDEKGDIGLVRPYIIPDLPINLWGQDIMEQMGVYVINVKILLHCSKCFNRTIHPPKAWANVCKVLLNPLPLRKN